MKVLVITGEYPFGFNPRFGGGGAHVFYLALSLAKHNVEVMILTYEGAKKDHSPLEGFDNIKIYPCDFGQEKDIFSEKVLKEAQKICLEHKPDIIHGHHLKGGFIGITLSAAFNIPMILTMHKPPKLNVQSLSASPPKYQRERFEALWRLLATDDRIKAHIAYSDIYVIENKDIGVVDSKIKKISHGIPIDFLQQKSGRLHKPKRFKAKPGDTLILCPMRPEKRGVATFIEAADIVRKELSGHKLHFLITGNPKSGRIEARSAAMDHQAKARRLGLDNEVMSFSDFTLRQMWEIHHRSEVCILPSYREGLSIALLEAMAIGTTVIASEVHGMSEVIVDGVSGLIFSPDKPKELAEKIIEVLLNQELKSNLIRNAQERITQEYSDRKMAQEYINLYNSLI